MHQAGDTIGRYTVEAYLGEGGMGRVYQAYDPMLDRRVALKIVRAERGEDTLRDGTSRLLREARAAAKLDHPNAVSVFDVGEIDGTPFLAMELIHGRTLRAYVGDESVSLERRLGWLADVARALSAAHRAGIVHRDVKPDNVMVRDDGVVKVLDFGLARRARGSVESEDTEHFSAGAMLTAEGLRVGTPLYMTPEQIRGDDLDGRSDQFAWGVLAYEMLTGNVPWKSKRDPLGLVAAILTQAAPPLEERAPGLAPELGVIVAKCLAKASDERFASMDDVVAALVALGGPRSSRYGGAPRSSTTERPRSSPRAPSSRRASAAREALPLPAAAGAFAATMEHRVAGPGHDESFRLLIERAPEGILISRERIICYANHAMVTFLGYAHQEELVGRSALEVVHPEDRSLVAERLQGIDISGVPAQPRKMRFLRRDGTTASAESIGVPLVFNGVPAIAAMIRASNGKSRRRRRRGRKKQRS